MFHRADRSIFSRGGIHRFYADGDGPPADWRTALPEDLRGHASLKDYKDLASLAKSHVETKAMVGSSIRVPGPDASPEARAAFRERLRKDVPELVEIPKDPEKLKASRKEILESLGWPKDAAKEFTLETAGVTLDAGVKLDENELRQAAVELGLDKEGFAKLALKTAAAQGAAIKRAQAEQSVLKGEWGAAYEERRLLAQAALEKTGAPDDVKRAIADGTAPAAVVKWAYGLAKSLGAEAREVGGQRSAGPATVTPTEALSQINEIEGRAEYFKPTPRTMDIHRQLVAKHAALMALAYPDLSSDAP